MERLLHVEELEERIAPTTIGPDESRTFGDSNGDNVTISYRGPDGSRVIVLNPDGLDWGPGDDIGTIAFEGATIESRLVVDCDYSGDGDIVIVDGISAPGQSVGLISLGMGSGEATLGAGAAIAVGGTLGTFAMYGDFDSADLNHSISAGADIGTVHIGRSLHLDSVTGEADITAGTGGAGSVHMLYIAGGIFTGSGNGTPLTPDHHISATTYDTAPTGEAGSLNLGLTGVAAAMDVWAVPVTNGSIISRIIVYGEGATLTVSGAGRAGDIANVEFDGANGSLEIAGSIGVDVYMVDASQDIASVINGSPGGDIGVVDSTDGGIGLISTGRLGNLGAIFDGPRNSIPAFMYGDELSLATLSFGAIGSIRVGEIAYTSIMAGQYDSPSDIGAVQTGAGGIHDSSIIATGNLAGVTAGTINSAEIAAYNALGDVTVGRYGIFDASITGVTGIASVTTAGAMSGVHILAADGGEPSTGGAIGTVRAGSMVESDVRAYVGIDHVAVRGGVYDTVISSRFEMGGGSIVGGYVTSVVIGGGMAGESSILACADTDSVKIGRGGMASHSEIVAGGAIASVRIAGDALSSTISSGGAITHMRIGGDAVDLDATALGGAGGISIGGSLISGKIVLGDEAGQAADSGNVRVVGGVTDTSMSVYGSVGVVSIGGRASSLSLDVDGAVAALRVGKSLVSSTVDVGGLLGPVTVGGGAHDIDITADGGTGAIAMRGSLTDASIVCAAYDGDGHPVKVNIGSISADGIFDTEVRATGDITAVRSRGIISNGAFQAVSYDEGGAGAMYNGGSIGPVKATGLVNGTTLEAYSGIGRLKVGDAGIDATSHVANHTGVFEGLMTTGVVRGLIDVNELAGNVLTAGGRAVLDGGIYYFTDTHGALTMGSLKAAAPVDDTIVVS